MELWIELRRRPFYSIDLIVESLKLANVLKVNDQELPLAARLSGCSGNAVEVMQQPARQYGIRLVALTRGPAGAVIVCGHEVGDRPGVPVDVVDTVGAGDAFTASMTLNLLAGRRLDDVNRNAIATASHVCAHPGATMPFPDQLRK